MRSTGQRRDEINYGLNSYNNLYVYWEAFEEPRLNDYLKKNPKFFNARRWTDFGSLTYGTDDGEWTGDLDYGGHEYGSWYSVDTKGQIRMHAYTTSGLSRTTYKREGANYSSKTRGTRATHG